MNQLKRRSTYQYETITQETRRRGPDVWAYRHFEFVEGSKRRRKTNVGTLEQYQTRGAPERACEHAALQPTRKISTHKAPQCGG